MNTRCPAPRRFIGSLMVALIVVLLTNEQAAAGEPNRPVQVGYKRQTFEYVAASGEKQARQLDLWYPTLEKEGRCDYRGQIGSAAKDSAVSPGAHPLLIFSHGYLGMSDQSIFLTENCARAGYIVVSMNHADSLAGRAWSKRESPRFADFANWSDAKFADRREDLVALLDQLLAWNKTAHSPWEGRIDERAIGGAGHSLGGYSVLGLAGGWPAWKEPRLKAAVLYSPFAQPYDAKGDLASVAIPVMLQGGTFDFPITPSLPAVYRKLGGSKSLLVLKNETHFGWTNLISLGKTTTDCVSGGNAELMVRYTIAFFDQHLLAMDRAAVLEGKEPRLESYRFEVK